MSKRKAIYEEELELFASLGIFRFYMGDANFGLHKEDEEITNTLVRLTQEKGYPFKFFSINFSKVKKDVVYRLADKMLEHNLLDYFKCSIQDMHTHILENIDRPDVPWDEQIVYLKELVRKHPNSQLSVEVIQGLPGQTRETWENMLFEMSSHGFRMNIYKFMMIPNSPAGYDKAWNERMKIKTGQLYLDEDHSDEYVIGTYSYDLADYAYFSLLSEFYARTERARFTDKTLFKQLVQFTKTQKDFSSTMQVMTTHATYSPASVLLASYYFNKNALKFAAKLGKHHADYNELLNVVKIRTDLLAEFQEDKFKKVLSEIKNTEYNL